MPSVGRRKPSVRAWAADLLTCAVEMISNALATAGIGPRGTAGLACQRASSSLQPPQPGSSPTPTSTSPVYVSACACTASQCISSSQPPPSAMPDGAATTGTGAYFIAL